MNIPLHYFSNPGTGFRILLFVLVGLFPGCEKKYPELSADSNQTIRVQYQDKFGELKSSISILSVPPGYQPDKSVPIVLLLHGSGANAEAFLNLWEPALDSAGIAAVAVQGSEPMPYKNSWDWGKDALRNILSAFQMAGEMVNINKDQVYVVGFSSGGSLAHSAVLKYPNIFNGIAAIGAPFLIPPDDRQIHYNFTLGHYENKKVYIGHGTLEKNYSSDAKGAQKLFDKLNMKILFRAYDGIGHALPADKDVEIDLILNFLLSDK